MACAAAAALLASSAPRASAWCGFDVDLKFGFAINCWSCCCCPSSDSYCGWPGYHLDGGYGDGAADGYPVADHGYPSGGYPGAAYGYPAPAYGAPSSATPAPSGQPARPFPPAPKPADDKQTSYRGPATYPYQQTGYSSYGYPSSGSYAPATGYGYGSSQVPSYWYGR
jgi:hypothetical protein